MPKHILYQNATSKVKLISSPRQHYQKIRKESKTGSTSSSSPKKSTSIKSTPRKGSSDKSTNASFTTNGTSSFGHGHDDDDEEELNNTPMKRKRTNGVKNEVKQQGQENSYGYYGGQTGSQFKIEDVSGAMPVVDLEHDEYVPLSVSRR
jgi:hypothetical protein